MFLYIISIIIVVVVIHNFRFLYIYTFCYVSFFNIFPTVRKIVLLFSIEYILSYNIYHYIFFILSL